MCKAAGLGVLFLCAGLASQTSATPYFSIDSADQWAAALADGRVSAVDDTTWSQYQADNPGFYPPEAYSVEPVGLYVYEESGYFPEDEGGLVMTWGDSSDIPPAQPDYTGAWQFDYPADPNLVGSTLLCSIVPPQVGGQGQVNSVGIGLIDGAGLIRSWTWNCAAAAGPGTIAWNQLWTLTIGPISGPIPPAWPGPAGAVPAGGLPPGIAPVASFSQVGFNPANVVSIVAMETGQRVGNFLVPPPPLPAPLPLMWNFWGRVAVTPEPGTFCLLALGACGLALRRRRR
jgi:hypothetical protein